MADDISTWFNGWDRLWSIAQSGIALYVGIILFVRIFGKRTTSQMNNFDWIITVALGGLVGSGILLKDVSVADAVFAAAWLMFLQWVTTSLIIRSERFCKLVRAEPTLLVNEGQLLTKNMRRERISSAEVSAALRDRGMKDVAEAQWVILETDATFSVVPRIQGAGGRAPLIDVVRGG